MDRIELRGLLRYSVEHGVSVEVEGGSHVVTLADVAASLGGVLEIADGDEVIIIVRGGRGGPRGRRLVERMVDTLANADVPAMSDLMDVLRDIYAPQVPLLDGPVLSGWVETAWSALRGGEPGDAAAALDDVGTLAVGAMAERARIVAHLRRVHDHNPACPRAQFGVLLADELERGAHAGGEEGGL